MRRFLAFFLLSVMFTACGDKETVEESPYLPPTTPANVLYNLQVSYVERDVDEYAKLLADDFRFFIDEGTRQQNHELPVFLTRLEDSTQTGLLFSSPTITDIRVTLTFSLPGPAPEPGRTNWITIDVLDTFLEVDVEPGPGESEGTTFRVDGQRQKFYFRKGRTPDDTTSVNWYITEWIDLGDERQIALNSTVGLAVENPETLNSTWSRIKLLTRKGESRRAPF